MALVSVVIPAYNLEKYLPEALEDLRCQTLTDWEVIVVDDGSTDTTVKLLEQYHEADPRITYIEQPHENAGAARNRGLAKATGKYVLFLDGDDRFEPTMMEELYARAEETQADIVLFDAVTFVDGTGEERYDERLHHQFIPDTEVFNVRTHGEAVYRVTTVPAWTKFYRREFVEAQGLQFQSIAKSNDGKFVLVSLAAAERISILDRRLVRYRIGNSNSLQGQVGFSTLAFIDAYIATIQELQERGLFEAAKKGILYRHLKGCLYEVEKLRHISSRKILVEHMKTHLFPVLAYLEQPETDYLEPSDRWKLQRYFNEVDQVAALPSITPEGPYVVLCDVMTSEVVSDTKPDAQLVELAEQEDLDGLWLADEPGWYPEILTGPEMIAELQRQKQYEENAARLLVRRSAVGGGVLETALNLRRTRVVVHPVGAKPEKPLAPAAETMLGLLQEWTDKQQLLKQYPLTTEQRIQWNHILNGYKKQIRDLRKVLSKTETVRFQMICPADLYYVYASTVDDGNIVQKLSDRLADQKKETTAAKKAQAKAEKADQQHKQELTQEINRLKAKLIKRDQELETIKESLVFRVSKKVMIVPNGVKKLLKK